jgi:hypothetical protein
MAIHEEYTFFNKPRVSHFMTIEAFNPTETITVIPENPDEVTLYRRELARLRLGRACAALHAANEEYYASIEHFTEMNQAVRNLGYSPERMNEIAASTQSKIRFFDEEHGNSVDIEEHSDS